VRKRKKRGVLGRIKGPASSLSISFTKLPLSKSPSPVEEAEERWKVFSERVLESIVRKRQVSSIVSLFDLI